MCTVLYGQVGGFMRAGAGKHRQLPTAALGAAGAAAACACRQTCRRRERAAESLDTYTSTSARGVWRRCTHPLARAPGRVPSIRTGAQALHAERGLWLPCSRHAPPASSQTTKSTHWLSPILAHAATALATLAPAAVPSRGPVLVTLYTGRATRPGDWPKLLRRRCAIAAPRW